MMELTDAYKVASAIAECWAPPVVRSVFNTLNEKFPYLKFEYSDAMKICVTEKSTGYFMRDKPDDDTV